jgi:hypothetical protein
MFLPHEFVERAWTHAVGERTGAVGRFFAARDGLEQAHLNNASIANTLTSRFIVRDQGFAIQTQ